MRKCNHFVWAAGKTNMMKQSLDGLIMFHISIHYITDVDIILQKYFELDYIFWWCCFSQPCRNLPPLTWCYWLNRLSNGSLWNLDDVQMKSYPSANKSSISKASHFNIITNGEAVRKARVNFSQLGTFFCCQSWIRSAMARKDDAWLSPITAAFPI